MNKHVALSDLFIYVTWKNKEKQQQNYTLKIIALTRNDEFELPNGSYFVLDIQDYFEYVIKH